MRKFSAIAIPLALCFAACGSDDDASPSLCAGKNGAAGERSISIESGGLERTFLLSAPESALNGGPVPLVLVFHGVLADGNAIQTVTGFPEKAAQEGFITVAGDGIERSWNAGLCCDPAMRLGIDDVTFARDMVAAVEAEYCIDPERIFVTGFSNGAAMAFKLTCDASDLFAGFAPVGGTIAQFPCEPSQPRPVETINNLEDPVVPFRAGEEVAFPLSLEWNGCADDLVVEQVADNAECRSTTTCDDSVHTGFCAVGGLGHVWPGGATDPNGDFSATDHIWDFFAAVGGE